MGSAIHQLSPRYSGTLTPLPLNLLGYGKPLPSFILIKSKASSTEGIYNKTYVAQL